MSDRETGCLDRRLSRAILEGRVLYGVLFVALTFVAFLATEVRNIADRNSGLIREQATQAIARCAATSAVIEAGRLTITGEIAGDPDQAALRRMGFPPKRARDAQAQVVADAYANHIREHVTRVTGKPPPVNKDGTLDCRRLAPGSP